LIKDTIKRRIDRYLIPKIESVIRDPHIHLAAGHLVQADHPTYAPIRAYQTTGDDGTTVKVGRYSSLNHRAYVFMGAKHHAEHVSTFHFRRVMGLPGELETPLSDGPIVIGSDVWVAFEAIIMSGVTVGDGAIVAARAVVTRDVEPYEIVGGVPARHVGWRFDAATRQALLRIRWWDWPVEKVIEHIDELESPDLAGFIAKHDPGPEGPEIS
jgi:hypothetical protein